MVITLVSLCHKKKWRGAPGDTLPEVEQSGRDTRGGNGLFAEVNIA